jgi:hypothetical protein
MTDCKRFPDHLVYSSRKMAANTSLSLRTPGVALIIKYAYFSVPIFQPHRKYLRFLWQSKLFEFTCLPFWYSLAPRVFTKIFKPIMAHFRFLH